MMTDEIPVVRGSEIEDGAILESDVVIIGSGAGGAVAAYELARRGKNVTVIEAGPYIPSTAFNEHYAEMMAQLFQDGGRQTNVDGDLVVLQGACVGGSTVVNAAACFRTPKEILEHWVEHYGLTEMTTANLDPLFAEVEQNLSVHINAPHEIGTNSRLLQDGCDALGYSHKPLARNTKDCVLSGYCLAGCATDRKQSMLVTYLPWAMQLGARVIDETKAVEIRQEGRSASSVLLQGPSGQRSQIRARQVIIAAGAVQSPLLLQRSNIGDQSLVGHNFACHPSLSLLGYFDHDILGYRGATVGTYCDEFDAAERGGFIFEGGMASPDFLSVLAPGVGSEALEFMRNSNRVAGLISLIHDQNSGRIFEKNGQKSIDYQLTDGDRDTIAQCLREGARILLAAGANTVVLPTYSPIQVSTDAEIETAIKQLPREKFTYKMTSYHPQGTLRMAANASKGVVRPDGRLHDIDNVWVVDASLFPSSIMVNPQMTVYTLATKIAREI